jgi:hypothetical protein
MSSPHANGLGHDEKVAILDAGAQYGKVSRVCLLSPCAKFIAKGHFNFCQKMVKLFNPQTAKFPKIWCSP